MHAYSVKNRNLSAALFIMLFALVSLSACGGKKIIYPPVAASDARAAGQVEEPDFSLADSLYKGKQYEKAVQAYRDYIDRNPNGPFAPAAWMKIAQIQIERKQYESARQALRQILARFPRSPLARDARWEILNTLYAEERYTALIPQLKGLAKKSGTKEEKVHTLDFLGDVYMAVGEAQKALESYAKAYENADRDEKSVLFVKMEKVLDLLSLSQAQEVLADSEGCGLSGLLTIKIANDHINAEEWSQATIALNRFLEECPDHERAEYALILLDGLRQVKNFRSSIIGCLLPLTGRYGRFGNQVLAGVELAASIYNMEHPGAGAYLEIIDTKGDPDLAREGFEELSRNNAALIIGPILGAEAVAEKARELRTPAIVFTQKSSIPEPDGYLFRNYLTPEMQARSLADYAMSTLGLSRFAILYPDDDYGEAYMKIFWDEVAARGGMVKGVESYKTDQTDFADPIKKLVGLYYDRPEPEEKPNPFAEEETADPEEEAAEEEEEEPEPIVDFEAVFIPDAPRTAGLLLPQLKYHDIDNVLLMGTNLWHSPNLIKIAKTYSYGAVMPDIFFKDSPSPQVKDFVTQYADAYGADPGFLEALGFDAANLAFQSLALPQVYSRESLRTVLTQQAFQGVTGLTVFNGSGEVRKDLYLLRITRRGFEQINRPASDPRSQFMGEAGRNGAYSGVNPE